MPYNCEADVLFPQSTGLWLLQCIELRTLHMPGCFFLRVDKLLPQSVTGLEVNRDAVLVKEPLEFSDNPAM